MYETTLEIKNNIRNELGTLLPKQFSQDGTIKLSRGKKCDKCNNTGYLGRIGLFEILMMSPAVNKLILEEASGQTIQQQAKQEGLVLIKQDGYLKALEGITTLEEVMRVTEA